MAISLTRSSWSFWGDEGKGKEKEPGLNAPALNSSTSCSERGLGVKKETKVAKPRRKVKRSREETSVGCEYDDVVLVTYDDVIVNDWCLSGYESDDSDWSIGWMEPLQCNDDDDDDFAVLVPCYTPSCKDVGASNNVLLSVIKNLSNEFSSPGKNYTEQWLVSLQNFEA